MLAAIWPENHHLEETISTLRFAQRMMKVQNDLSVNIQLDPDVLLKKYERQIKDLKLELAMHDTLVGRGRVSYEPYTPQQQYEQQQIAMKYLKGEMDDIDVNSIRQVKELFAQFRNIYRMAVRNIEDSDKEATGKPSLSKVDDKAPKFDTKAKDGVGLEDKKFGFGIGKAPKDSKPTVPMDSSLVAGKKDDPLAKDDKGKPTDNSKAPLQK